MADSLFFRLDASPTIGLGHLRRCAVLAQAALSLGAKVHFIIRSEGLDLTRMQLPAGSIFHALDWLGSPLDDAERTVEIYQSEGVQIGVVDHYRLDEAYQQVLNAAGLRWMQFGNPIHHHTLLSHWVHDATPGVSPALYQHRVKTPVPVFITGPTHALVNPDFVRHRAQGNAPSLEPVSCVLLTFGGGNDQGAALQAMRWLNSLNYQGKRVVLTTRLNPSLLELEALADKNSNIELHVDNWQPAALMAGCQLALCAGGTTLYELACLGIPAAILTIADNQHAGARAWDEAKMGIWLGDQRTVSSPEACTKLQPLLTGGPHLHALAQTAWQTVDGLGAERVARQLLGLSD